MCSYPSDAWSWTLSQIVPAYALHFLALAFLVIWSLRIWWDCQSKLSSTIVCVCEVGILVKSKMFSTGRTACHGNISHI